jgi:sulfur-oxidizing protein SoxX
MDWLLRVVALLLLGGCASVGDVSRGREVFVSREQGHCVLCHSVPGVSVSGNVGPSLAGVAARLSPPEIRLRIEDITRVNPNAPMPAYRRTENLTRVAAPYAGKPILSREQVDDLVAYLSTLR